jgi:hypothetical protein
MRKLLIVTCIGIIAAGSFCLTRTFNKLRHDRLFADRNEAVTIWMDETAVRNCTIVADGPLIKDGAVLVYTLKVTSVAVPYTFEYACEVAPWTERMQ